MLKLLLLTAQIAVTNVTVLDPATGAVSRGQTILVAADEIVAVGDAVEIPAAALRVDANGGFALPTLWDMHIHPGRREDLALLLANGVGGARIMFGAPEHLEWRASAEAGDLPGPRLTIAGPIIEGLPPAHLADVIDVRGRAIVMTPQEARAEARRQHAAGYDYLKVYNNLPLDAYRALGDEGKRLGMPVVGHIPFQVGLEGALAAGQQTIEHLRGYVQHVVPATAPVQPGADLRSRTLAWQYADDAALARLAAATAAAGSWHCPTLMARTFLATDAVLAEYLDAPAAEFLSPELTAMLADRSTIPWLSNFDGDDFAAAARGFDMQNRLLRALFDAGVPLLAGTDNGPWGYSLHMELERLRAAGFSNLEVLRFAVTEPVRYLGVDDVLGRIAPGFQADFILLNDNPFDDVRHARRIRSVFERGRYHDRAELDAMLDAVRAAYASN